MKAPFYCWSLFLCLFYNPIIIGILPLFFPTDTNRFFFWLGRSRQGELTTLLRHFGYHYCWSSFCMFVEQELKGFCFLVFCVLWQVWVSLMIYCNIQLLVHKRRKEHILIASQTRIYQEIGRRKII